MKEGEFHITNQAKGKLKRLPFSKIKEYCVGKHFSISLVFVGERKACILNYTYRKKKYIPNVLSFPLQKNSGEIFICLKQAGVDARKLGITLETFVQYLFIHGLFHLKGLSHGSTMEMKEETARKKFNLI